MSHLSAEESRTCTFLLPTFVRALARSYSLCRALALSVAVLVCLCASVSGSVPLCELCFHNHVDFVRFVCTHIHLIVYAAFCPHLLGIFAAAAAAAAFAY